MPDRYTVHCINDVDAWSALREEWNALVSCSPQATVFSTFEWLDAWQLTYLCEGRRLYVLTVRENGELIGAAPWSLHRRKVWRTVPFLRIESLGLPESDSDYLDVISRPGREREVAEAIYHCLFDDLRHTWHALCLQNIPADSLFLLHFLNAVEHDGKFFNLTPGVYCPVKDLPARSEELLDSISARRRKRLMQEWRSITRAGYVEHVVLAGSLLEEGLERFFHLYRLRWNGETDRFSSFLAKFAASVRDRGWMEIDVLCCQGRDIAAIVHFNYGGHQFGYLQAVDHAFNPKLSVGNSLIRLAMERSIASGIVLYDFLAGSEDFKFIWANRGKRSLALWLYRRHLASLMDVVGRRIKDIVKLLIR